MGTDSHFRIDNGCCISELRLRKWCQSPFFPTRPRFTTGCYDRQVLIKAGLPEAVVAAKAPLNDLLAPAWSVCSASTSSRKG
jgi:hypothetical protein